MIGETGWATRRNDQGDQGKLMKGVLGEVEQARYLADLEAWEGKLSALGIIHENPGITQADLGKKLNIKRANMVPVMAELEGRGLIARRPSDSDRRAHVVALTPAGLKMTVKLLELHRRLEDDLAKELGQRERDQLLTLLKRFRRLATVAASASSFVSTMPPSPTVPRFFVG